MKRYFTISKETDLTELQLGKILATYQTRDLPRLRTLENYYNGRMAITYKQPTDEGRSNAKIVINHCKNIVDNYCGYMLGNPIKYEGENIDAILDINEYNDAQSTDESWLRQALIYGKAYCINYLDEEGKQRFKVLDTKECIPVYDDTLEQELLYVIRCYKNEPATTEDERYNIDVYGQSKTIHYLSGAGFKNLRWQGEEPNFYKQVPITVFSLNDDEAGIFENVMSINDAINSLVSGEIDSWDSFADAYLVLKGVSADEESLADMKKHRCLCIDPDADASFLTKNIADTQVVNILTDLTAKIHQMSACPDFTDESFAQSSGIAIKFKLLGFENVAGAIEAKMKQAIQRRIELISSILKLTDTEEIWRTIKINFNRNLPTDYTEIINLVTALKGLVSDETLLAQIPFVQNVQEELARVKKQNEQNMELYQSNFSSHFMNNEEEEEINE